MISINIERCNFRRNFFELSLKCHENYSYPVHAMELDSGEPREKASCPNPGGWTNHGNISARHLYPFL